MTGLKNCILHRFSISRIYLPFKTEIKIAVTSQHVKIRQSGQNMN